MTIIHIRGMKCQHCAGATQKALEALGATEVQVDIAKGEARFEGSLDPHAVRLAIAAQGFEVVD
ncbi:MAG: heavy-metal-associated domain-containing protein [Desulfobulbaceae bacterium]|jgi:copper chaperone CopZ|nr:heavy-metal-associated domain-containing protein [Desulfobulbaceae bacterium]